MNLNLTIADSFSVAIIALLFTLLIYHFFIYFGRKGEDRIYYIYFSLFALNFALYLLCVTGLHRFIFVTEEIQHRLSPAITGITYFLMLLFACKMFSIILNFPHSRKKVFLPYFISFLIYGLLVSTYLFLDYDVYIQKVFPWVVLFATLSPLYMFSVYIIHIVRQKPRELSHNIILAGFFIFMLDFGVEEILPILNIDYPLKGSYFISGISALLWAFALAIRFNNEYKELQTLKQSLEIKVVERTQELEEAIEQRTNMFINLAHEVKTPLTLMRNYVDEHIKRHGSTCEMEIIKDNTEKMVRDIVNFFTEEKFRVGTIDYNHSQILNFSEFVESIVSMYQPYLMKKELNLEKQIEKELYLKADPGALNSLVNNLLENAIKYTPEKGLISVSLGSKGNSILFTVQDNGSGIPKEAQKKIFEPYYQVSEKKQNSQGMGMGLSIVHKIVQSLGGKINLNSEVNTGTTFTIELNRHALAPEEKSVQYEYQQPVINSLARVYDIVNDRKHSVLVVEDNLQMLRFIAENLKHYFKVFVAENGKKALEKLNKIPKPDLIISDIMMDHMGGFEFFQTISHNGLRSVPLIFLTAKTTEKDKDKGLEMGAIDYIQKPFKIQELVNKAISITNKADQKTSEIMGSLFQYIQNQVEVPENGTEVSESKLDSFCYSHGISRRQKEVIKGISNGSTYKEIATELCIAETTVAKHVQNIFEKTGIKNKVELVGRVK